MCASLPQSWLHFIYVFSGPGNLFPLVFTSTSLYVSLGELPQVSRGTSGHINKVFSKHPFNEFYLDANYAEILSWKKRCMNLPSRASSYSSGQGFSNFLGPVIGSSAKILYGRRIKKIKRSCSGWDVWVRVWGPLTQLGPSLSPPPLALVHHFVSLRSLQSAGWQTALENTQQGVGPQTPGARAGTQQLHTEPSATTQEKGTPPSHGPVCPLAEGCPLQVDLSHALTYRSRTSLHTGPSPGHLFVTSCLSGPSSGPLDTSSSSPSSCAEDGRSGEATEVKGPGAQWWAGCEADCRTGLRFCLFSGSSAF